MSAVDEPLLFHDLFSWFEDPLRSASDQHPIVECQIIDNLGIAVDSRELQWSVSKKRVQAPLSSNGSPLVKWFQNMKRPKNGYGGFKSTVDSLRTCPDAANYHLLRRIVDSRWSGVTFRSVALESKSILLGKLPSGLEVFEFGFRQFWMRHHCLSIKPSEIPVCHNWVGDNERRIAPSLTSASASSER